MSKEERYAEHTVAWELSNGDSVTKGNYNLADIETKYIPIQTELVSDDKDKKISDLEAKLANNRKWLASNEGFLENQKLKQQLAESEIKYAQLRFKQLEKDVKKYKNADKELLNENINLKDKVRELKQQLETQENTITNLVEDNRASQEWYKKQLAESESRFQAHKQNDARIIQDQTDLIENLKQQVKEKEKENELMAKTLKMTKFVEKEVTQDKISFAVEQLEKVKEFANNEKSYDFMTEIVYLDELLKQIDNQIKAIKGDEVV